jgi:serine/threonine protein kinase
MADNELTSLAHYKIIRKLGRGSFAEVYQAEDTKLGRDVALKVPHPQLLADPDFVRRFQNDARAAARLDHPYIVTIYDIGEAEGRLFIAMQYCIGDSLADRIDEGGPLSFKDAATVVAQIAEALDYAHGLGFIHRDVKPSNVFFDAQGNAVLGDFGLVKSAEESVVARSSTGGIVGTLAYIAPEIWDDQQATPATDVYALGAVLYEMLTGEALFDRTTPLAMMKAHVGPRRYPATWSEEVPTGIEKVLNRALQADPEKRYARAGEFAAALDGLAQQDRPDSPKILRWASYAVVALVVLLIGFRFAGRRWFNGDAPAQTPLEPTAVVAPTATSSPTLSATPTSTRTPAPTSTSTPRTTATSEPTNTPMPTASTGDSSTRDDTTTEQDVVFNRGNSAISGRIVWNDQPIPGMQVDLIAGTDLESLNNHTNTVASVVSQEDGSFVFTELGSGQYRIYSKVHTTTGERFFSPWATAQLGENEAMDIGDYVLQKMDARVTSPVDNEVIPSRTPTFQFEEYPGADYYRLLLRGPTGQTCYGNHDAVGIRQTARGGGPVSYTAPSDANLCAGDYEYDFFVYNANDTVIARTWGSLTLQ